MQELLALLFAIVFTYHYCTIVPFKTEGLTFAIMTYVLAEFNNRTYNSNKKYKLIQKFILKSILFGYSD